MNIFMVLALASLLAAAVTLARGIASMMRGGERDHAASTQLMWRRVEFQAAALAFILAALFFTAAQ